MEAPTLSHEDAQKQMQAGDILLAHRTGAGRSPLNWVIEKAQRTPYAHAALYTGDGNIVHTYAGKGTERTTLDDFNKNYGYQIYRPNVDDAQKQDALKFVNRVADEGRGYNVMNNIKGWLPTHARNVATQERLKARASKDFNCGGLVASAYAKTPWAGGKIPTQVIPGDFSKDPNARLLGTVANPEEVKAASSQAFLVSPGSYTPQGMSDGQFEIIRSEGERFQNFKKMKPNTMWKTSMVAFLDELQKLGTITDDEAHRALERYEALEKGKATKAKITRYGLIGAAATPAISALGDAIAGNPLYGVRKGPGMAKGLIRGAVGRAVTGGLASSTVPIMQHGVDRRAEMKVLSKYIREHQQQSKPESTLAAGELQEPFDPPAESMGGVSKLGAKKQKGSAAFQNTPAQPWSGNGVVLASFDGEKQAAGAPTRGGFLMASEVPAFRVPSLRAPGWKEKESMAHPGSRLNSSQKVGAPKVSAPPGPSVAAQTGHQHQGGIPGARKGTIGMRIPKMTPTMPEAGMQSV